MCLHIHIGATYDTKNLRFFFLFKVTKSSMDRKQFHRRCWLGMWKPCCWCLWSRKMSSGNCSWTFGCLSWGYSHSVHPHCSSHSQGTRFACWVTGRSCSHCLLGRWAFHKTVHCVLGYQRFVWGWSAPGGSMHSAFKHRLHSSLY